MAAGSDRLGRSSGLVRGIPVLLVLAGLGLPGSARALDLTLLPSQYLLGNDQIPDGLARIDAQALARTSYGYLWVRAKEAHSRCDGVSFTVYEDVTEPG